MASSLSTRLPFLLLVIISYVASEKFYIITSPGQPCPRKSTEEQCLTLQQFAYNSSSSYSETSQLILELQPGIHALAKDPTLTISRRHTVMNGSNATILCGMHSFYSFEFVNVPYVTISGINFINCGKADFHHNIYMHRLQIEDCNFLNQQGSCSLTNVKNATIVRSSFSSSHLNEAILQVKKSLLLIKQSMFINITSGRVDQCRSGGAAIDCENSVLSVEQTIFSQNRVISCFFIANRGVVYTSSTKVSITDSKFTGNKAIHLLAYITYGSLNILNSIFSSNTTYSDNIISTGGGLYIDISNSSIFIYNSTFINNSATSKLRAGGGAIHVQGQRVNFSLIDSSFINNSATLCAALNVQNSNHTINIIRSNFVHNRESGMVGDSGYTQFSGVACITGSNISVIRSTFTENEATGHAGVFHVERSTLHVQGSIFSRNKAGRDGGVIFSQLSYAIISVSQSSFTYNRAGGNGGVIYVRSLGKIGKSEVTVSGSRFSFNSAGRRGGILSITGGQVDIGSTTIYNNTAGLGGVISACVSEVKVQLKVQNELLISEDPINPQLCTFYDTGNISMVISPITSSSDKLSSTLNATLSISVIIWILVLILYTVVVCIILYLCGVLKCKREKSSDVDDDHMYIPINELNN